MALVHVPRSEREDFDVMLRQLGRSDEFEATDSPAEIRAEPGAIGPTIHCIVVRSRLTGVKKTYTRRNTVNYSAFVDWVNEVADDIRGGTFKLKDESLKGEKPTGRSGV